MAKIYSSQNGNMRGRIGNTVYRKGQRATIGSQYQPQVANPKTQSQAIQRAAFATAAAAMAGLKSIVDHSHEGISSKRENLQKFIRENAKLLAGYIKLHGVTPYLGSLNLKGVAGIQPAPYLVSTGSVPSLSFELASATGGGFSGLALPEVATSELSATISTQSGYEDALALLGLVPGDQLSVIQIMTNNVPSGSYYDTEEGTIQNISCHVLASRVTFKTSLPEGFSGTLIDDMQFNSALIERSEGNLKVATATATANHTKPLIYDGRGIEYQSQAAGCLIRSQVDLNGKYSYSLTYMAVNGEFPDADAIVRSYMPVEATADGSDKFLDNPALPFV